MLSRRTGPNSIRVESIEPIDRQVKSTRLWTDTPIIGALNKLRINYLPMLKRYKLFTFV